MIVRRVHRVKGAMYMTSTHEAIATGLVKFFTGNVRHKKSKQATKGFTLIELLVTMTIIALLLSIVTPRFFVASPKPKELVLFEDLVLMSEALDKYHADNDIYPDTLEDLITKKYLRKYRVTALSDW